VKCRPFVYASKLRLSELLWWMGEEEQAKRLHVESQELKKRFNERFWMEEEGFLAIGIDAKGQLLRSIASDAGQCLTQGILDDALAPRVIMRIMAREMFSGWGVRTLSAGHPAYNPFAYHRGTVLPVMNGMLALGFAVGMEKCRRSPGRYSRRLHCLNSTGFRRCLPAISAMRNIPFPVCTVRLTGLRHGRHPRHFR
jgi:glycogen debranching enzyme